MPEIEEVEEEVTPEDILGVFPTDDADPGDEEGAEEQEVEEEPTEEVEGSSEGEEQPAEEEPPEEAEAEPEQPAIELVDTEVAYGGQTFALQVTPEQAKALEAMRTTAEQFPHLQAKYTETLEQSRMAPPPQEIPAQPTEFSPEAFRTAMQTRVQQMVGTGAISEDFAELYPDEAAGYAYGADMLQQIAGALGGMAQHVQETTHTTEVDNFKAEVFGNMRALSGESPEIFGDLQEPENQESFLNYLTKMNLTVNSLQGEAARHTLSQMWGAYKSDELRAAASAAAQKARVSQEEERRNAGGAGGGGKSRSKPKPKHEDIAEILSER